MKYLTRVMGLHIMGSWEKQVDWGTQKGIRKLGMHQVLADRLAVLQEDKDSVDSDRDFVAQEDKDSVEQGDMDSVSLEDRVILVLVGHMTLVQ